MIILGIAFVTNFLSSCAKEDIASGKKENLLEKKYFKPANAQQISQNGNLVLNNIDEKSMSSVMMDLKILIVLVPSNDQFRIKITWDNPTPSEKFIVAGIIKNGSSYPITTESFAVNGKGPGEYSFNFPFIGNGPWKIYVQPYKNNGNCYGPSLIQSFDI